MTEFSFQNQTEQLKSHFQKFAALTFWFTLPYFLQHFNKLFLYFWQSLIWFMNYSCMLFLSVHLFYLSILSIFLFCLMIDKKTAVFWKQPHVITRGNMMSYTFSLHGVSNQPGSTFWMSHGQTPYFMCFFVPLLHTNGPHAVK